MALEVLTHVHGNPPTQENCAFFIRLQVERFLHNANTLLSSITYFHASSFPLSGIIRGN